MLTVVGVLLKLGTKVEQGENFGVMGVSWMTGEMGSGVRSSRLIRGGVYGSERRASVGAESEAPRRVLSMAAEEIAVSIPFSLMTALVRRVRPSP